METGSDDENDTPTKKRKYQATIDDSSDIGEGTSIGSELADLAQAGLDHVITA